MILSELLRLLERKNSASISLEVRHPAFYRANALKLAPDQYLHHSSFCRAAKMSDANFLCSANKHRSLQIASFGRSFCGCCPHGIWELAQPLLLNGELACVLYLGNFREQRPPTLSGVSWNGVLPPEITPEKKLRLRKCARFLAEFIRCEIELFAGTGAMDGKQRDESFYLENCRRFIDCHYLENIALSDLADLLKIHPNYLGALLKKQTGQTFRGLLNSRRIDEAKVYLKLHKNFSVSKIARLCGFSDSNYFSAVFHKLSGVSPGQYRKNEKTE